MSAAKTNAERQKDWRDRNKEAAEGTEVRGIFAPQELHTAIKAYAAKLQRKRIKSGTTKE